MSTVLWIVGFVLMMVSFTFLFGSKSDQPHQPRISVDR